eukprot:TRINITY_DN17881_c0_g1_i1.p1 TRINITY_DN17881_c0_g1~~TRINITY_DN17881_c0_g1_i1.p1  ORF type:complete len:215 (+),score=33.43 TRINITY_DN17881_c0_g1_i1:84-728(+)
MSAPKVDVKVVILGRAGTGKTCLVQRFLNNTYNQSQAQTVGAAFGGRKVEIGGSQVVLGIWDTAGSERFESMSKIYYRGAKAAVVCYDLLEKNSLLKLKFWISELLSNEPDCAVYVVGNKADDEENIEVSQRDAESFVMDAMRSVKRDVELPFMTTASALTGKNVETIFFRIAADFLGVDPSSGAHVSTVDAASPSSSQVNVASQKEPEKKPCC